MIQSLTTVWPKSVVAAPANAARRRCRFGLALSLLVLTACDREPSAEAVALALEQAIRTELAAQAAESPAGQTLAAEEVAVSDVVIRHAAPVTDYWTVWTTFTLHLDGQRHHQDVTVRLRPEDDGWAVISLERRPWGQ